MHLSLEQLLAVRDGEADAEAVGHVAVCGACATELERLRAVRASLSALPDQAPPRDLWPAVRVRAAAQRQLRGWIRFGWVAASLAAAFTLVIGVRGALEVLAEARLARQAQVLVAESQRLEQALRASERDGRVMSGRTAGTVVQLEDHIAAIDAELGRASADRYPSREIVGLWQRRVELLDALVGVETSGTTYVGL